MDGPQKEGRTLSVSAIVVLLSLVGFVVYRQLPLEPTRPTAGPPTSPEQAKGPDVEARLWQDPFAAVVEHRKRESSTSPKRSLIVRGMSTGTTHGGDEASGGAMLALQLNLGDVAASGQDTGGHHGKKPLLADIAEHGARSKKITVLGVMVFGGPYAEQAETRRRWRYATVSALASSGYVPEDSEKVGYYQPSPDTCASFPEFLPYEWFVPARGDRAEPGTHGIRGPVLVMWIDDGQLAAPVAAKANSVAPSTGCDWGGSAPKQRPLYSLLKLLGGLKEEPSDKLNMRFKIIGPAGTTTLTFMVNEVQSLGARESDYKKALEKIGSLEIYSATATGDDCLVLGEPLGCDQKVSDRIQDSSLGKQLRLARTIGTDSVLAGALAQELHLRGALSPGSHVVLISEWDTDYGRALPKVVANAVEQYPKVDVDQFSYLRGLDGLLPGESPPPKTDQKTERESPEAFEKERPMGRARYDYLRRIVKSIQRRNLALAEDNQRVRAVGVLGSDFYDKQLILQAVRPVLTNVFFFTTDLDARLLHPADFKWNRNLIIASSFGLQLAPGLQQNIPPFRSGYQSSIYLAGLRALNIEACVCSRPIPHIYEVGRSGAFDLTRDPRTEQGGTAQGTTQSGTETLKALLEKGAVYPKSTPFFPTAKTWWEVFWISIVSLILIGYMSTSAKVSIQRAWTEHRRHWPTATMLFILSAVIGWGLFRTFQDEPFSLFDGISAWPSTLLRILAIVISAVFIFVGRYKLKSSDVKLGQFISQRTRTRTRTRIEPPPHSSWMRLLMFLTWPLRALWTILRRLFAGQKGPERRPQYRSGKPTSCPVYSWRRPAGDKTIAGEDVWQEYQWKDHSLCRLARIAVPFLGYIAILIGLVVASEPSIPVRGQTGVKVAEWISLASFASMSLLTFLVVDATHLCRRFLEILSEANVHWNPQTKEDFKRIRHEKVPHDEWITLEVISEQANTVAQLIIYPFVVLLIVIVSRLSFFDNWDTPLAVALIYLTLATYAFVSVFILHKAAERARSFAVDALEDKMIENYHNKEVAEEFRVLIDRIRSMRHGAFRPLAEQPVVKALLLPFGGGLGLVLLDYLNWLK